MNPDRVREVVVAALRATVREAGLRRGVVPLSGRLDEVVVAALAAEALGVEQVRAVGLVNPEAHEATAERVRAAAGFLAVPFEDVNLTPHLDALLDEAPEANPNRRRGFLSRIRVAILHDRATSHRALVLGAVSKTDRLIGRCRRFGEEACALNPIGDLYATEVREIAERLAIPEEAAGPEPTVELPETSVAGGSYEPTYRWIDPLLRLLHDGRLRRGALVRKGYEKPDIHRLTIAMRRARPRRRAPIVPVLSDRPLDG